jgi:hypothetical protein
MSQITGVSQPRCRRRPPLGIDSLHDTEPVASPVVARPPAGIPAHS